METTSNIIDYKSLNIAVMVSSYRRLNRLAGQINTLLNQTFPPKKIFVAVKGYAERDIRKHLKTHFADNDKVIIKCMPNSHMLTNILDSVRGENIEHLDLIIKIDDDDMYPVDFIEKVAQDFVKAKQQNSSIAGISYSVSQIIKDNGRHIGQSIASFGCDHGNILGYVIAFTPNVLHWLFLFEDNPHEALSQTSCAVDTTGNINLFLRDAIKINGGLTIGNYIDGVVYNNVDPSILKNGAAYTGISKNNEMSTWKHAGQEEFHYIEGKLARICNKEQLTWVDDKGTPPVSCQFIGSILIIQNTCYTYDRTEAQYKKLNSSEQPSFKWGVCAVSLLRDSFYWIEDWIDYHIKMGVSKIVIYDNSGSQRGRKDNDGPYANGYYQTRGISKRDEKYFELTKHLSDQNIREQIDAIAAKHPGIVEIVTWKPYDSLYRKIVFDHIEAQDDCLERYRNSDMDWFAFIDVDEYLYCKPGITIESILQKACNKHPTAALIRFYERISQIRWEENGPGDITKLTKVLSKCGPAVKNIARLNNTCQTHLHYDYILDQSSVIMASPIDQLCIIHYKGTPEEMKADGIELNIREIAGKPADPSIEIKLNNPCKIYSYHNQPENKKQPI